MEKWKAAAEKGTIKTLESVHQDYMRISGAASPKSTRKAIAIQPLFRNPEDADMAGIL